MDLGDYIERYIQDNTAIFIISIIVTIIIAVFCSKIAVGKGRNGGAWFLWGLLFGVVAILIVSVGEDLSVNHSSYMSNNNSTGYKYKENNSEYDNIKNVGSSKYSNVDPVNDELNSQKMNLKRLYKEGKITNIEYVERMKKLDQN